MIKEGDLVKIVEDEYKEFIGLTGRVDQIGPDGTTAWVQMKHGGVWCSVVNLAIAGRNTAHG